MAGPKKTGMTKELMLLRLKEEFKDIIQIEINKAVDDRIDKVLPMAIQKGITSMINFPLSVRQVAELTGHTEACIYKRIQRGQMPYSKVGGIVYININDVNDMLLSLDHKEMTTIVSKKSIKPNVGRRRKGGKP